MHKIFDVFPEMVMQKLRIDNLLFVLFFFFTFCGSATANTYEYDQYHRLTRLQNGSVIIDYVYDSAGNRLSVTHTVGDSDLDGIPDIIESIGCTGVMDADTDDDGIIDGDEDINQNNLVDPGETDPCNSDTDGDGIQDGTELGLASASSEDTLETFIPDSDPSTTTNPLSSDSDGDWILDGDEDLNHNGQVDEGESDPLDQDTTDTDTDGLFDALENQTCTSATLSDTDGDTILDGDEDSNHNGVRDGEETDPCNDDTDGDGLLDNVDPNPLDTVSVNRGLLPALLLLLLSDEE